MSPPSGNRKRMMRLALAAGGLGVLGCLIWFGQRPQEKAASPVAASSVHPLEDIELPPVPPHAVLSEPFQKLLQARTNGEPGEADVLEILPSLGGSFSSDEAAVLLTTLLEPRAPDESAGIHSLRFHEASLALKEQVEVREQFARVLATVARDTSRDEVVRDYALQHLRQVWERATPALKETVQATFIDLLDNSPGLVPSALLSLHLLGNHPAPPSAEKAPGAPFVHQAISNEDISPRVRSVLNSPPGAETSAACMTALRIIGDRKLPGFREDLHRTATAAGSTHPLVRMAAISAIARVGDPASVALLESIQDSDPRVLTAIQFALNRLKSQS